MNVVAFIFARGGSKGLPGKNIRSLGAKPLIAWAIEHALSVKRIARVFVSTDSEEIAAVARKHGAIVPFLRPEALARDDSPEWLAWQHALCYLKEMDGMLPDVMVSVPTTAPLRLPIDIENCLDEYEKGDADVVVTVTDAHRNPYFNMVKINSDGNAELVISTKSTLSRRQDSPKIFNVTTVAYVARPDFVISHAGLFDGRVRTVHVPVERTIDIDTLYDFHIAECLLKIRTRSDVVH